MDCHEIWYLINFRKSFEKIKLSLKSDKNNFFNTKTTMYFWQYLVQYFFEWETFQGNFQRKSKHIFSYSVTLLRKSHRLWDNVEKYWTAEQVSNDNMAHAYCMLCNYVCKHTLKICNAYCFSNVTMVVLTRHNVKLHYIACLVILYTSSFTMHINIFAN